MGRGRGGGARGSRGGVWIILDLLGAPALVGLAHVGGGLDGGDELEGDVADADEADDAARDDAQDAVVEQDAADEDVEGAAAGEGEEEGRVPRQLRRDLELEQRDAEPEDDHVDADDQGLAVLLVFLFTPLSRGGGGGGVPKR